MELDSESDEIMEHATNTVIELILLAKRKEEFAPITQLVIDKVENLQSKVQKAVDERDTEKGN